MFRRYLSSQFQSLILVAKNRNQGHTFNSNYGRNLKINKDISEFKNIVTNRHVWWHRSFYNHNINNQNLHTILHCEWVTYKGRIISNKLYMYYCRYS